MQTSEGEAGASGGGDGGWGRRYDGVGGGGSACSTAIQASAWAGQFSTAALVLELERVEAVG